MISAVTVPPRALTTHNQTTLAQLEALIKTKPLDNSRLLTLLLAITADDADNPKLNSHIERIFNLLLMAVLSPVPSEAGEER